MEREIAVGMEQAKAEGKPEAMLEKIAMGKLNKFYKENTLLEQSFVKDNSLSVTYAEVECMVEAVEDAIWISYILNDIVI